MPSTNSIVKNHSSPSLNSSCSSTRLRMADVGERAELALEAVDARGVDAAQGLERDAAARARGRRPGRPRPCCPRRAAFDHEAAVMAGHPPEHGNDCSSHPDGNRIERCARGGCAQIGRLVPPASGVRFGAGADRPARETCSDWATALGRSRGLRPRRRRGSSPGRGARSSARTALCCPACDSSARVVSGSLPACAVSWSTVVIEQRSHGLTTSSSTGRRSRMRFQLSSANGSTPRTTMFGRKRFIGTRCSMRPFRSSSEASDSSSSG